MKLYTLRHKQGNRGIQLQLIELKDPTGDAAIDLKLAEEIGKSYCNRQINSLFIRVDPAIVADETILSPAEYERVINPPKPKPKQRLKPGEPVPDNPPEGEVTDQRPTFDGNLDNMDLGPDEDDEDQDGHPAEEPEQNDEETPDTDDEPGAEEGEAEEVEEVKPKGRARKTGGSRKK